MVVTHQSASFSGPIPSPVALEKYNEIIPNGADRIMVMAENQSAHREEIETLVIKADIAKQTRGSIFGFIISLVAIIGGFVLIEQGKSAEGLASIITSLSALVGIFFYSKYQQKQERIEKSTALQARKNG
jgi:uncharacterized membrane protein